MIPLIDLSNLDICPFCDKPLSRQQNLVSCSYFDSSESHHLSTNNNHINLSLTRNLINMNVILELHQNHIKVCVYINNYLRYFNEVPYFEINNITIKDIAPKI